MTLKHKKRLSPQNIHGRQKNYNSISSLRQKSTSCASILYIHEKNFYNFLWQYLSYNLVYNSSDMFGNNQAKKIYFFLKCSIKYVF